MAAPESVTRVGIIGCGNISSAYVNGCRMFDSLRVVAVADLAPEAAQAKAAEHDLGCAGSVEELLADPDIDIVINLTIPAAHAAVSLAALAAGKHVYSEKPLAVARADGQVVLAEAAARGLRVGGAPDTFLGGGLQTCRKLIDDGAIGEPVAATAFMLGHGPESWHPNPGFFYRQGAGPLFDMGPYYLTALIHLLGPVERVAALARISFAERMATSDARRGQ
jgi:predicted dehydrogenase